MSEQIYQLALLKNFNDYLVLLPMLIMILLTVGYLENTKAIMEVSKSIQKGLVLFSTFLSPVLKCCTNQNNNYRPCRIKEIAELSIIGRPDMTIVAFGSDVLDIFEVNDIMSSKGWHLNALQRPNR